MHVRLLCACAAVVERPGGRGRQRWIRRCIVPVTTTRVARGMRRALLAVLWYVAAGVINVIVVISLPSSPSLLTWLTSLLVSSLGGTSDMAPIGAAPTGGGVVSRGKPASFRVYFARPLRGTPRAARETGDR